MALYEYELGKAADILVRDLFKLKRGETLAITADTESDQRVVDATARAAFSVGAKPMVITTASPLGVAEAADPMLPVESLAGALKGADAWIEYNNQWLLYSTPYNIAMKENSKLRYMNLLGMNAYMMIRCIGRVDFQTLGEFLDKVYQLTINTKHFHFTTPAGTDLEFDYNPDLVTSLDKGFAHQPGEYMLAGQIAWAPKFDTINGTLVFDGSIVPPTGKLNEPVIMTVKRGEIVKVEGGMEAVEFERWMDSFDHPQMRRLAHVSWAFHPGAKLTGDIVEDERVWGATKWGIGAVGTGFFYDDESIPAPSHCDGICLNTSAWLDGTQILDKGKVVHDELVPLAKKLGKG